MNEKKKLSKAISKLTLSIVNHFFIYWNEYLTRRIGNRVQLLCDWKKLRKKFPVLFLR